MYKFVFLLISLASQTHARDDIDFCFADEDDPYLYLATKTAYHFVHGGKTRFQIVPNCQPVQIWMLAAHGTRCPSINEIDDMLTLPELQSQIISNHETHGNGRMCNRDLENLRRWRPDAYLAVERAKVLTPQGVEDMKLLARRLQSNFPELLQPSADTITSANYKFKTVDARDSMESFMDGLFGDRNAVLPEIILNDTLISPYKTCNVWDTSRNNDSLENEEQAKFDESPLFENLVHNVSRRLGFLYNISAHSVITIYNACRYEKAWTVIKLSPWCAVFSKEELRLLEYREDLHYYYTAGYGREINAHLGCTLIQDVMDHFWRAQKENFSDEPKGVFYFADIVSLLNLLSAMGVAKDRVQLTASNYNEMIKREWRTSFIASFAANLVAVSYKCNDIRSPHKAMFYLAEKPVMFDGCEVGLCDWEYLEDRFGEIAKTCNLDVCWQIGGAMKNLSSNLVAFLLACFSLVFFKY